jgi:hypothetical protein
MTRKGARETVWTRSPLPGDVWVCNCGKHDTIYASPYNGKDDPYGHALPLNTGYYVHLNMGDRCLIVGWVSESSNCAYQWYTLIVMAPCGRLCTLTHCRENGRNRSGKVVRG